MTALEDKGRKLIADFALPEIELWPGYRLSNADIAATFQCALICDHAPAATLEPRASRTRGRPHLPKGAAWPERTYFQAQLDVEAIARFNLWARFPSRGTVYLFFDPETQRAEILHSLDEPAVLSEAPSALPHDGEYYQPHFLKTSYALSFRPMFSLGFEDKIPAELTRALEDALGFARAEADDGEIGGAPVCYQGEDVDELFAPEDWDFTEAPPPAERFLLFQDHFGEGHAHFWVPEAELEAETFSTLECTYSGT